MSLKSSDQRKTIEKKIKHVEDVNKKVEKLDKIVNMVSSDLNTVNSKLNEQLEHINNNIESTVELLTKILKLLEEKEFTANITGVGVVPDDLSKTKTKTKAKAKTFIPTIDTDNLKIRTVSQTEGRVVDDDLSSTIDILNKLGDKKKDSDKT